MDPGAMANAMIFVSLLVLTVLIGGFTFLYAAYCFLVVVQETAAGADEVRWPHDPLYDKLPRAGYLACLLAIWIAPAGLLLKLNPDLALGGSPFLTFLVVAIGLLWVLFPIGLFSALSASSPWIVFRLTVLGFFARRFGATVAFYFVSALLAAGSFGLLMFTFARGSLLFTFAAPFVVVAAFLIYARLLGRMAYLFDQLPLRGRRRPSVEERANAPKRSKKKKSRPVDDPWAVPQADASPRKSGGKAKRPKGYALAADDAPAPVEEQRQPARQVKGYRLADDPLPNPPPAVPQDGYVPVGYEAVPRGEAPGPLDERPGNMLSDFEQRYRPKPESDSPPPAHPLASGVYSFPFYLTTIPIWVLLSLGGIAGCGLIQLMLTFKPG